MKQKNGGLTLAPLYVYCMSPLGGPG